MVYPELIVCGYPPEDLVLKPFFQDRVEAAVATLQRIPRDGGPAMLVSAPWRRDGELYSAVMLLDGGEIAATRLKYDLPNYSVFDEKRVFKAGPLPGPMPFRDVRLGVMICEDMWRPDVTECLEESGAEMLIVVNGSPFESDKIDLRIQLATQRVTESGLPLVYVNQVGGQDELVFDGASFVLNADRGVRGLDARLLRGRPDDRMDEGAGRLGPVRKANAACRRRARRPCTAPWRWVWPITCARTAFPASSSACPAASIRR